MNEITQELPENLVVGSAVLADKKLQNQLVNKKMIVRRHTAFELGGRILKNIILCFVLGMIVTEAMDLLQLYAYLWFAYIAITILVFVVIYRTTWVDGMQDCTFVLFNNLPPERFRGFFAGFLASIPWIVGSILFIIANIGDFQDLYNIVKWVVLPFRAIPEFLNPSGFIVDITSWRAILIAAIPFYIMVAAWLGYFLGFRKVNAFNIPKQIKLATKRSI